MPFHNVEHEQRLPQTLFEQYTRVAQHYVRSWTKIILVFNLCGETCDFKQMRGGGKCRAQRHQPPVGLILWQKEEHQCTSICIEHHSVHVSDQGTWRRTTAVWCSATKQGLRDHTRMKAAASRRLAHTDH